MSNAPQSEGSRALQALTYENLLKRDKVNLDIFWLKDESLEDSANLPDPRLIAEEIAEIAENLKKGE